MVVKFFGDGCNSGHELKCGGEVAELKGSVKSTVDH